MADDMHGIDHNAPWRLEVRGPPDLPSHNPWATSVCSKPGRTALAMSSLTLSSGGPPRSCLQKLDLLVAEAIPTSLLADSDLPPQWKQQPD